MFNITGKYFVFFNILDDAVSFLLFFGAVVRVRLDYPYKQWKYATVIYTTSHNSPFDLAVLQLEGGGGVFSAAYGCAGIGTAKSYTQGDPFMQILFNLNCA